MPISQLKRRVRSYGDISSRQRVLEPIKKIKIKIARPNRKWLKKLLTLALAAGAVFFVCAIAVAAFVSRDLPDPNKLIDRQVAQSTKIYDRTGEHLLYEIFQNQKRTMVNLDQVAPMAVKATIAIEDKYFYEHSGIRVSSILRAGFNNFIGRKAGSGGASTLTQQLIKNAIIGDEHSYFRKIKEAILALQLEKKYSKDQILKMYFNEIPYGSTNYGIEAASQSYFHKNAKDLTLAESATLAALAKAPSKYLNNIDALRTRRDYVLDLMFEQGVISEEEKKDAQGAAPRFYRSSGIMDAPHFVLYVKQQLADRFGENLVDTGGLKVLTSLDYDKQMAAEKIIKEQGDKFAKESNANNAALVAIDPKTGQILAMVGSRDFFNEEIDGQFNVATLGKRQPGSSFKPFVYLAAFEKGYTPDTVLYDTITAFGKKANGEDYIPKNYDDKEHGLVTMRKALQGSLNIPAVKTLYLVGPQNAIEFAKRFGYTTFTGDYGLSLVLGGAEVNLLEHTDAYATLANNGVYNAPSSILKVTNPQNEILYEWQATEGTEAVKPELAALIGDVLTDDASRAFVFGGNSTLTLPGRKVAAKTGTTNDYKDAWTMGYVPSLAAGVWVGNTTPSPMKGGGNKLAGLIWNNFMKEALKNIPPEPFPDPPVNDALKPVLRGSNGGLTLKINRFSGKLASSTTPERLVIEKTFLLPHDILYYVNKDDPRGSAPANPAEDSQYEAWEEGLQSWIMKEREAGRNLDLSEPPTEYDILQSSELSPSVDFIYPEDGQILNSRQIDFQISATAPRGVSRVLYYIDGQKIGESNTFPFNLTFYAKKIIKGEHALKAIAEDDLGNGGEKEIKIILDVEEDPPSVEWFDSTPLSLSEDAYPRPFLLSPFRWEEVKDIKIYLGETNSRRLIYTFKPEEDKIENGHLSFTWQHSPGKGISILTAVLTDKNNNIEERDLEVNVR
ncbi:MAG: PBP1A family penicillin-binding protein [Patescibacteria group bacterium]